MDNIPKSQCLRCTGTMQVLRAEKIQLGQYSFFTGALRNLLAGSLEVAIHICSECRKVEFYLTEGLTDDEYPKITCPECGSVHDFDYPKCPNCKHKY